jgi:hypothetical protein
METHKLQLEEGFTDSRGKILPIVHDFANVQMIWSKKGALRANHYHKTDTHTCYLVTGSIDYYWRNHGEEKIYKEQLAKGKSEVYAHHYSDLMANGEYHEIYCEEYAFAYDKAISENKSSEYASVFANKYASELVDIKRRYGISEDEEMIDFAIEKVNAYMKAWQYGEENQLKDFELFAEIYENIHLNTCFLDDITENKSSEEFDKLVLEKTLERFNK